MRTPEPELQNGPSMSCLDDPRGFGGDQRRIVQVIEQRRLEKLGNDQRRLDYCDRCIPVDHPTLRNSPERHAIERARPAHPIQEVLPEEGSAVSGPQRRKRPGSLSIETRPL